MIATIKCLSTPNISETVDEVPKSNIYNILGLFDTIIILRDSLFPIHMHGTKCIKGYVAEIWYVKPKFPTEKLLLYLLV